MAAIVLVTCIPIRFALAYETRLLRLRPLPTTKCGERTGEREVAGSLFGPEAPEGFVSASLDWRVPDSTRLFFAVETRAGRYRDAVPLRIPAAVGYAEIQTIDGQAGVFIVGLAVGYGRVKEPVEPACLFAFTACRLSASGAPECSPVRVVAEGHFCPGQRLPSPNWPYFVEEDPQFLRGDAAGHAQLLGRPISWDPVNFRPLPGPLPPEVAQDWGQPGRVDFSHLYGMRHINFIAGRNERKHRIVLKTSAGCFWDRRWVTSAAGILPASEHLSGTMAKQILGKILLVTWTWGVGIESDYIACRHGFMACQVDEGARPHCSAPATIAKAKVCEPPMDRPPELSLRIPPATPRPDGNSFELDGVLYRIVKAK